MKAIIKYYSRRCRLRQNAWKKCLDDRFHPVSPWTRFRGRSATNKEHMPATGARCERPGSSLTTWAGVRGCLVEAFFSCVYREYILPSPSSLLLSLFIKTANSPKISFLLLRPRDHTLTNFTLLFSPFQCA